MCVRYMSQIYRSMYGICDINGGAMAYIVLPY